MSLICTSDDEFVRDRLRWVVTLDDGTVAYEDDGRPGSDPPQAWLRLGRHCREHGIYIDRMSLQFRSHLVDLPEGASGYFLIKQAAGILAAGECWTEHAYIAGVLGEDGRVYTTRWRTPELTILDHAVREVDPGDPCLIARPGT